MQHDSHLALFRIASRIATRPEPVDTRSNDELLAEIEAIIAGQEG